MVINPLFSLGSYTHFFVLGDFHGIGWMTLLIICQHTSTTWVKVKDPQQSHCESQNFIISLLSMYRSVLFFGCLFVSHIPMMRQIQCTFEGSGERLQWSNHLSMGENCQPFYSDLDTVFYHYIILYIQHDMTHTLTFRPLYSKIPIAAIAPSSRKGDPPRTQMAQLLYSFQRCFAKLSRETRTFRGRSSDFALILRRSEVLSHSKKRMNLSLPQKFRDRTWWCEQQPQVGL